MDNQTHSHTFQQFDRELASLHQRVTLLAQQVQQQLSNALRAVQDGNSHRAREVCASELHFQQQEREIDQAVLQIIARHNPVASDLRRLLGFSRIARELAQTARETGSIARQMSSASSPMSTQIHHVVAAMGLRIESNLQQVLEQLELEPEAVQPAAEDDDLQRRFDNSARNLLTHVIEDARNIGDSMRALLMVKSLERIGECAHNIHQHLAFMQGEGQQP